MTGCSVSRKCRVACLRSEESAAPDVTAGPALPKCHPRSFFDEAFLACARRSRRREVGRRQSLQMLARRSHRSLHRSDGRAALNTAFSDQPSSFVFRGLVTCVIARLPRVTPCGLQLREGDGGRAPRTPHIPVANARNMRRRCVVQHAASLTRTPSVQPLCHHRTPGILAKNIIRRASPGR